MGLEDQAKKETNFVLGLSQRCELGFCWRVEYEKEGW